jgi:heme A synthase
MRSLSRYAWATLWFNVGVIVFGAYVRATGSGAGCGASWPTCNGQIIPSAFDEARAIEFTHRATSGVALILVAVLVWWIWRAYPAGHRTRRGAAFSGAFIIGEALIGAMIVLYEWVADDASAARTAAVPLHLVNTLLLLAALTLTAWWVSGGGSIEMKRDREYARWWLVGGVGVAIIAATGAITALADTLFPSESVIEGLRDDFTSTEHFLTNLRVAHPIVAVAVGVYLVWLVRRFGMTGSGRAILGLVGVQMLAGAVNIALLTPVWMQLVHLLLADLLWVSLVLFGAERLSESEPIRVGSSP